jgi:tRNA-Thr(GGU) m(6)t(6)A37 methyltransferase TsaA
MSKQDLPGSESAPRGGALTLTPIGIAHTPFTDKRSAPRQPAAARGVAGTIELFARSHYEHALCDLEGWSHIWVIFWFHRNQGWSAKVLPPRSKKKRGVLATRSPHRPNPLGLSVLSLERVEGRILHVRDLDLLDGTPVLDIKPYVPYCDSVPSAQNGWLKGDALAPADPGPRYVVSFDEHALEQLGWLAQRTDLDLRRLAEEVLAAGPTPHPYRRIKREGGLFRLAVKDFRLRFSVERERMHVLEIATGYRKRVLDDPHAVATEATPLSVHRAFVRHFGPRAAK